MGHKIKGLVLASALFAGGASAELSYTYVEGGLGILSPSGQTYIGPDLRASYLINENVFAFGGFRFLTDDFDYTNFHVGAAYRQAIDARTDWWAGASIDYQEIDGGTQCFPNGFGGTQCFSNSFDDTAPAIRGGIRHQLDDDIELGVSARLVTGDADYFGLNGQARFRLQDNLSLTGEVDLQDGDFGLFGGVTLFF